MTAAGSLPPPDPQRIDHRIRLQGVSWQVYEAMLAWRGERSGVHMTYLEGELELMSPAREHELDKTHAQPAARSVGR